MNTVYSLHKIATKEHELKNIKHSNIKRTKS